MRVRTNKGLGVLLASVVLAMAAEAQKGAGDSGVGDLPEGPQTPGDLAPPPLPPNLCSARVPEPAYKGPRSSPTTGGGSSRASAPVMGGGAGGSSQSVSPPSGGRSLGSGLLGLPTITGLAPTVDLGEWDTWWRLNRHEFLRLREHVWRPSPVTGDGMFFLGDGQHAQGPAELIPSDEVRRDEVAPALKRAIAGERSSDALAASLLALAKLGEQPVTDGEPTTAAILIAYLAASNQQVREVAALGLGLLGEPEHLSELAGVMAGDQRGEDLVGGKVDTRTRAFAAYGLGLLAERSERVDVHRFVAHRLVQQIERRERKAQDLAVACVNALALLRLPTHSEELGELALAPPSASSQALVAWLLGQLDDRRVPDRVRAHVPRAVARHVDPFDDPLKELVAAELCQHLAHARRSGRELQYGSIQALGSIGTAGSRPVDVRIREVLRDTFTKGDLNARNLSLIALAKIGARPHHGSPEPLAGTEPIRRHLALTLLRGSSRTRPWAALALGVHGFHSREAGIPLSSSAMEALRGAFEQERSPADASVLALALGLRGDTASAPQLLERLHDVRDEKAQGHLAIALGLVGAKDCTSSLRELLENSKSRPELFGPVSTALALLGDKSLVPELSEQLLNVKSGHERSVRAVALCQAGDARSIEPVIAVLIDPNSSAALRWAASIALGSTCEQNALPWNTALSSSANYLAAPSTFTSPTGGGVCDLF